MRDHGIARDLVGVARSDVLVCYLTVFVDDEYGSGCEAIAEQVKYVIRLGHRIVAGCVKYWEFDADLRRQLFGTV